MGSNRLKFCRLPRIVWLFAVLSLFFASGCRAQDKANNPAEFNDLLKTAAAAANGKDYAALKPLTGGDPSQLLAWIKDTIYTKWEADYLLPPGYDGAKNSFIVFHHWHTCESDGDHIHPLIKTAEGWKIGAEILETETNGYRVRDHHLTVRFDIPQKSATIHDTVLLEQAPKPEFPFALLRLSVDFPISRFTSKEGRPIPFTQVGDMVVFAAPKEQKFTLKLDYSGKVNHRDSDYIRDNEATLNTFWYPHIARLPATATVAVTAPAGWTPIAQGEQTAEKKLADGSITRTFRNEIPTCIFTVDIGKYSITERQFGRLTLSTYLLHKDDAFAAKSLDTLQKAMTFFEANFSRYPYTKYALVETLGPFPGALESYSFATFGGGSMQDTIPHELAHTWWGGVIPCAYTKSMWDESFAEYCDGLFKRLVENEADKGASALQRRGAANIFNDFSMTTAHDTEDERQTAVGYLKGSLVMRALESEIGLTSLQKCFVAFLAEHPRGELAEWPEFEAVVNKITGKNYRWFFAQWMERTGLPVAHLENPTIKRDGEDYIAEADFVQTSGLTYRMRVPLTLETDGGPVASVLQADGKTSHILIRTKSAPKRLLADPLGTLPIAAPLTVVGQDALVLKF